MNAVLEVEKTVGAHSACESLGIPKTSYYRALQPTPPSPARAEDFKHHRALSDEEQAQVLKCLNSERFMDKSPAETYATLLDEGTYYCSISTMYRILEDNAQVRERRDQLSHPSYAKPELLATGPNQVWSWDITKLLGPMKWTYFYLYVILDIFSRYVVGWMVATRESASLASRLIRETCGKHDIDENQLTIHSDRGAPMKSLLLSQLLAVLGVTKSFSRPHVSSDNPFSEAQFKTLKYQPHFPERFGCIEDARVFCAHYFDWYNNYHRHSGIALLTPADLHFGRALHVLEIRQHALDLAYQMHPERFVRKPPVPPAPPEAVWINPPGKSAEIGGGVQ